MKFSPVIGAAMGRFARAPKPIDLPPGRLVDLPGRGRTCVIDVPVLPARPP